MPTQTSEFKVLRKKIMLLFTASDLMLVIGGILLFRQPGTAVMSVIGSLLGMAGILISFIAYKMKMSKNYQKLQDDDDDASFKEITEEFGFTMTIMGLIFIIAMFLAGFALLYWFSHSWIKTILFFFAFEFVKDLREYIKIDQNTDD